MTKEMKPRERVLNALAGLPVDRTPVAIQQILRLSN